jgi:cytochrome c-type protein NapC
MGWLSCAGRRRVRAFAGLHSKGRGLIRRILSWLTTPSPRFALATLVALGLVVGVVGTAGYEFVLAETSTDEFCVSCHELAQTVGVEYQGTVHDSGAKGLHVTCADCHLPKPFIPKIARKLRAVNEIYHHLLGTIDTVEKFDAERMRMATWTWAEMNASDSRECRNCHDQDKWNLELQSENARKYHGPALTAGKTCIDCHKGLAHKLPAEIGEDHQIEGIDF